MFKILIVEDEEDISNILYLYLKRKYKSMVDIDIAYDCQSGKTLYRKKDYDILILDYLMSKECGDVLYQNLKKIRNNSDMKTILITGDYNIDTKKIFALGINCLLWKPLNLLDVSKTIDKLLKGGLYYGNEKMEKSKTEYSYHS